MSDYVQILKDLDVADYDRDAFLRVKSALVPIIVKLQHEERRVTDAEVSKQTLIAINAELEVGDFPEEEEVFVEEEPKSGKK